MTGDQVLIVDSMCIPLSRLALLLASAGRILPTPRQQISRQQIVAPFTLSPNYIDTNIIDLVYLRSSPTGYNENLDSFH